MWSLGIGVDALGLGPARVGVCATTPRWRCASATPLPLCAVHKDSWVGALMSSRVSHSGPGAARCPYYPNFELSDLDRMWCLEHHDSIRPWTGRNRPTQGEIPILFTSQEARAACGPGRGRACAAPPTGACA